MQSYKLIPPVILVFEVRLTIDTLLPLVLSRIVPCSQSSSTGQSYLALPFSMYRLTYVRFYKIVSSGMYLHDKNSIKT